MSAVVNTGANCIDEVTFNAPFGNVAISVADDNLIGIGFVDSGMGQQTRPGVIAQAVVSQIREYLTDPAWQFHLPVNLKGTRFQQAVWNILRRIRAGSVLTYGQIAAELNTSPRAVGNACRANPCPIVVPCHRVVGVTGSGGYCGRVNGPFLAIKKWLLAHEGVALGG